MAQVKLFGMLKTLVAGVNILDMPLADGAQVKDLVDALYVQYPTLGELLRQKKVVVSVNQEIAHWETTLAESDEIALLPPFAGGA
ncbi:MAG: MoaD/ThiS family protein [Nitrospirales bacterium]|jgi:molybdopterin synthase catalytic subunit|nr:MAG: MoaD/ThiS family protein [Nitrospirales bacterium]